MSALPYLPETIPGQAQCPLLGKAQLIHRGTTQLCLDLECVNIHTWASLVAQVAKNLPAMQEANIHTYSNEGMNR